MFGLSSIDIAVIVAYFTVVVAIGFYAARRIKNQEDYFLAGRKFGKFIQTFAAFGQATSADSAVGVTTTTFSNGIAGVWSALLYLFGTPMYWMVMPWMRRMRLLTLGDFFEERYGSKLMAGVYAVIGTIGMMTIISVGFAAITKTTVALAPKAYEEFTVKEVAEFEMAQELDVLREKDYNSLSSDQQGRLAELSKLKPSRLFSHIRADVLIWVVCFIVMIYAVAGGLEAAFLTDTLQGIFIIILSIILFPFAWAKINLMYGGSGAGDALRTMHTQLPESYFELFGSPAAQDFTWYYIAALTFMVTINVVIQPNSMIATGSAKGEYECRFGFVTGCYMKRVCTVLWGFFALMAVVLYHDKINDPDMVWGYATLDLLGSFNMGLVGLMIACLIAALMSTADCMMITGSSLLTHNIYRPLFPNLGEKHYVVVGRITGALIIIGGALVATQFDTILQMLKFWWEFNVMVAASFWLGMKWRRPNRISAWCSIVITAVLFFILPVILPTFMPSMRTNPKLLASTEPSLISRTYVAHEMDVTERNEQIEKYNSIDESLRKDTAMPELLVVGQNFEKTYQLPSKSIFWTKGIKLDDDGNSYGSGTLSLELVLLDKMGFNLRTNQYAMNETIRILIRTIVPFLILIILALLTKPDEEKEIDLFFVKMKTPVDTDPAKDIEEMRLSYADPHRFDHKKLFPGSNWEFNKWTKVDTIGFIISCIVAVVIIMFLMFLLSIGS
ncbi:MAG: sodium:solute symporter family protein [Planctomycetes bacterium]|nr:sodium:solute symporter family protein [Planctomycetota bacterium]